MSKLSRDIITDEELQRGIKEGLSKTYQVAKAAYGPLAGNVLLEQNYGDPTLSRDGVKNVSRLYLDDPVENMVAQVVKQASKKNNKTAGDGTTAVVILIYHLYSEAMRMIAMGYNRMEVSRLLKETAVEVLEQVKKLSKDVDDKLLDKVCKISASEEALGMLVSDIIKQVGADGGVSVEPFGGKGIFSDIVNGFYFKKGFTNLMLVNDASNLQSKHMNAFLLLCEKPMSTVADLAPILDRLVTEKITEIVLIGDCSPEVLEMLLLNRMKGIINVTPVPAPMHEGMLSLFMDDLALFTGGQVIKPGFDPMDFDPNYHLGSAEKVIINETSTTIIGGEGSPEDLDDRVRELKRQLDAAESEVEINALRDRLGRLEGKVAMIKVGGATEFEQQEVILRVEDAVCAGQSALKRGIVPGGGVTLARTKTKYFNEAFKQPFKTLCENAGLNGERLLGLVENTGDWKGFNLKNATDKPVDMLKAGVVDPTMVIEEIVSNATSVVSGLITTSAALTFTDREAKND